MKAINESAADVHPLPIPIFPCFRKGKYVILHKNEVIFLLTHDACFERGKNEKDNVFNFDNYYLFFMPEFKF